MQPNPRAAGQGDRAFPCPAAGADGEGCSPGLKHCEDLEVGDMLITASCRDGASRALGAGRKDAVRAETWQERSAGGELPGGSHCSPQTQYSTASKHVFLRQCWIICGNVKYQNEQQAWLELLCRTSNDLVLLSRGKAKGGGRGQCSQLTQVAQSMLKAPWTL